MNFKWFIYRGKPTRLAPIPKPAPCLAALPILGANMSKIANTHAATKEIITISSNRNLLFGMAHATKATEPPSIKYLTARFRIS